MASPSEGPNSRDKILDVAEARFAQRGYAGVGLREVAAAAGLGKSSLFHHFRSKAALYLAVLERVLGRIRERLEPALTYSGPPGERLDRSVDGLIDALAEHPGTARLLLRSLFEDDDLPQDAARESQAVEHSMGILLARIQRLIEDGIESGAFRAVSASHTLQTLIGATIYHFASGDFAEQLTGAPLFSADAVRLRKQEVKSFLHLGLIARVEPAPQGEMP